MAISEKKKQHIPSEPVSTFNPFQCLTDIVDIEDYEGEDNTNVEVVEVNDSQPSSSEQRVSTNTVSLTWTSPPPGLRASAAAIAAWSKALPDLLWKIIKRLPVSAFSLEPRVSTNTIFPTRTSPTRHMRFPAAALPVWSKALPDILWTIIKRQRVSTSTIFPTQISHPPLVRTPAAANWSRALPDLLWMIIERLPLADFIRFGAVCVDWQMVLSEKCKPPVPQPWLMLHPYQGSLKFLTLPDQKEYRLPLPDIPCGRKPHIASSVHGWLRLRSVSLNLALSPPTLLIRDKDNDDQDESSMERVECDKVLEPTSSSPLAMSMREKLAMVTKSHFHKPACPRTEISMFHPITGVHIRLPPIDTIPNFASPEDQKLFRGSVKVVVLPYQSTDSTSSFIAAATSCYSKTLVIAREGDESWTTIGTLAIENDFFIDQIVHKGQLFALAMSGSWIAYNLSRMSFKEGYSPIFRAFAFGGKHLVELGGDLLQVIRNMKYYQRRGRIILMTSEVKVFKFDPAATMNGGWAEMKSLGDNAIFLSYDHSNSISVPTGQFRELRGNSIYFMDRIRSTWKLRAYHVGNQSFFTPPWRLKRNCFPLIWFTPTMSPC